MQNNYGNNNGYQPPPQNQAVMPQGEAKQYKNANVGKMYLRNGQNGQWFSGDFCGLQINGRIDQQGNVSLQVPTEHSEAIKALVATYLEQSGLGAKQKAEYEARKAQQGQGQQNNQQQNQNGYAKPQAQNGGYNGAARGGYGGGRGRY